MLWYIPSFLLICLSGFTILLFFFKVSIAQPTAIRSLPSKWLKPSVMQLAYWYNICCTEWLHPIFSRFKPLWHRNLFISTPASWGVKFHFCAWVRGNFLICFLLKNFWSSGINLKFLKTLSKAETKVLGPFKLSLS